MSNPVPIYSQVLPKSQQQRGYKHVSSSLQNSSQSNNRAFLNFNHDPKMPQPGIFDPGFNPLNHNHGGNFPQFSINQNSEAYSRVEKFVRESAKRSSREASGGRTENSLRLSGSRRERQTSSHIRQAEHRINLRSISLNENAARYGDISSHIRDYNREAVRESKDNAGQFISHRNLTNENSRDATKRSFNSYDNSPNTKDSAILDQCKDSNFNKINRENIKDFGVGKDTIYENEADMRGYNMYPEVIVPDSSNRVHSVRKSNSSHKVTTGTTSTTSEKRKFYCREWAFQKIAHCLEQRPVSKTCGALVLGDAGSGKTTLCKELSQPGQGPTARQQRALQRRMLARHFLQGQNENSLTMGEFIRTLVMQILSHSTQHRQSLNKTATPNRSDGDINSSLPIISQNKYDQKRNLTDEVKVKNKIETTIPAHKTMERIHENENYNDLLATKAKINFSVPDENKKRPINTNPFLPNFGKFEDNGNKLYENHENVFLRNVSQHKDVKNSRLYRQKSEPPVMVEKKSGMLQKSLSTDSKESVSQKMTDNYEKSELSDVINDSANCEGNNDFKSLQNDRCKINENIDNKPTDANDMKEFKLPLSPGGNNMKSSRIPVANFKYPNVSGLSSAENSPSKLSNRSIRDGQRSSASDNSDNKDINSKTSEKKMVTPCSEDKKSNSSRESRTDPNEPEYQNVLNPSYNSKESQNMNLQDPVQCLDDEMSHVMELNVNKMSSLNLENNFMKMEQQHEDANPTKIIDSINDDAPPPIPSLPISPRTLIANCYYEKLLSEPEIQQALLPNNLEKCPDDCFKKAILFPLLEIDPPKQCLFLLVDSVDESPLIGSSVCSTLTKEAERNSFEKNSFGIRSANNSKTIAELLANHHHLFPQWLLLVCTARKQSKYLTKMFTGFRKISLDDLRKNHVTLDVQRYILGRLDGEPRLRQHVSRDAAQALDHLRIKSNGCFLYLERVLDGLADGSVALREIREIPGTLNGLYLWLCQRLFHGRKFAKVQPLLNILLAAKCGVDVEMLYKCLLTTNHAITREDFNKRLHSLKRILTLDTSSGVLSIFHHSFSEWLLDVKHCTRRFLCDVMAGHAALAMYYTLCASRLTPFEIHSFVLHMMRLEQHNNKKRDSKSLDGNMDIDKKIQSSAVYSNAKENTEESICNFDSHTLMLLWILDSGCKIETSLKKQVNIGVELGLNVNNGSYQQVPGEKNSQLYKLEEKKNSSNSLGNMQDIPEFLASFYCPTLPRDIKVLRTLIEMGAQPEVWSQSENVDINEQSYKTDVDVESSKNDDPNSLDIRTSQISLEQLLMLETSEEAPGMEQQQEELICLFDVDPLTGRAPIHLLAQNGDAQLLKTTLEAHVASGGSIDLIELVDRAGQTALQLAARGGRKNVVELLLQKNARADRADAEGWTPLRAAAWGGHTEVVELLLNHGCDVDCIDSDHRTALRAAAWSGHEEIVKLLLSHGADVNKTDLEGRTALIAAAYMGHTEIVSHLLDHGADIDHADSDGRTALAVAALCSSGGGANRGECVQLLLERGAAPTRPDKDGMTPLLVAAFEGHKEVIELLLEADADPEVADKAGRTPLWAAAAAGHASAVRALLFWGCCVDTIDQDGRTVLSVAAAQGSVEVVRQLVDRGLDEHHRDNAGWTPLHYAAFEGHMEVCEVILEAGAKIDETDNDGKAPLMLAAQEGHTRLVEYLIDEWMAPVDQHAHDGKTALRVASLECHFETVRALIERGADVDALDADQRSTLYILALDNRVSMARYLIQKAGADVETRDSEGRTPLHVSAWQGHYEMVNLLITIGGACIDARDAERRTPLHSASWRGQAAIVRLLLSKGADPNSQCDQGATPLGIASQEGHEECVLWLLQHSANPKHSDHCGRTPAKVALRAGHLHVCRLLERWGAAPVHNITLQADVTTNIGGSVEAKPPCTLNNTRLSPLPIPSHIQAKDCSPDSKRRSVHSSNSTKSSSNLTSSTVSSHQEVIPPAPPPHAKIPCPTEPGKEFNTPPVRANLALSFAQQVVRCGRRTGRNQNENVAGVMSPLYATPPHSPLSDICSPTQPHQPGGNASAFDRHFCRDTHMRIILGRENKHSAPVVADQRDRQRTGSVALGNTAGTARLSCRKLVGSIGKIARRKKSTSPIVTGKTKRNGIVTNPAMRLVANVRNGLDSAAANLRRTGVALAASASSNNPAVKTNAFQWKRETPL